MQQSLKKAKFKLEKFSIPVFPVSKLDSLTNDQHYLSRSFSFPPPICKHIRTRITPIFCFWKMLRRDVAACYRIAAVASMIVGGVSGGNADGATALDSLKVNTA